MTTKQTKQLEPVYSQLQKQITAFASKEGLDKKLTRHTCFLWIEAELGGLNPTEMQTKQVLALSAQLGGDYRAIAKAAHCQRLDVILDRLCEYLCPEEWAKNIAKEERLMPHQRVSILASIYGGTPRNYEEREIFVHLDGRPPKRDLA